MKTVAPNVVTSILPKPHVIAPEAIKAYADKHKLSQLDAYRDLYSQRLLDMINDGDMINVVREMVRQSIGNGVKS